MKDLRNKDVYKNWSLVKPAHVLKRWKQDFFTLLPAEKVKVRGTKQEIEVYDACFDLYFPVVRALQERISGVVSTGIDTPPLLTSPGVSEFAIKFGDVSCDLQDLDDEATIKIVKDQGESADVLIKSPGGSTTAKLTVVAPVPATTTYYIFGFFKVIGLFNITKKAHALSPWLG